MRITVSLSAYTYAERAIMLSPVCLSVGRVDQSIFTVQ